MPFRPMRKKPRDFERAHEVMSRPRGPMYRYITPGDYPADRQGEVGPRTIWAGMREGTTAHGIPHLSRAQGPVKKTFWAIMVTGMIGCLLYNFIVITMMYASYNVNVNINMLRGTELQFPAVTLCNMSPVRTSAFSAKRRRKRAAGCDVGWVGHAGGCYYFSTAVKKQTEAATDCDTLGAALVTVENSAENSFIYANVVTDKKYYFGLVKSGGSWVWDSGSPETFRDWGSGEPSGGGAHVCAVLLDTDLWNAADCNKNQRYVCEKITPTTIEPTSQPALTTEPLSTVPQLTTVEPSTEGVSTVGLTTDSPSTAGPSTAPLVTTGGISTVPPSTELPASTAPPPGGSTALPPSTAPDTSSPAGDTTAGLVPTTELTSPEYSTAAPGNATSGSCCCMCCFSGKCITCGAPDVTEAAFCASEAAVAVPTPLPTFTPVPSPSTIPVLEGSMFDRPAPREDFAAEEALTEALANLSEEEKVALGFQPEQMILDCRFGGSQCALSQFSRYFNPIHGNCYIFNGGWEDNSTFVVARKTGRRHGLSLILNIGQDEYVPAVGDTAGLRLVVHPQNRMPFPEDEGIMVSPGMATQVGIRETIIEKLGKPYGNCTDSSISNITGNVFEELYPVIYSVSACMKTCYQRQVILECGCADPYYPMAGAAFRYVSVKACSTLNMTQDDCKYGVGQRYNRNELPCHCPTACRDTHYPLYLSFGLWPSNVLRDDISVMADPKIGASFDVYDDEKLAENLIKLEVYFEELNKESITERAAYTAGSYLGDLGGVLGLYMGFSILTVMEFFEFGMDMIIMSIARRCRCLKKPPRSETGNPLPRPPPKLGAVGAAAVAPLPPANQSKPRPAAGYHSAIKPPDGGAATQRAPPDAKEDKEDQQIAPEGVEARRRRRPPPKPPMLTMDI